MRRKSVFIILFLSSVAAAQQIGDGVYWIGFTDKEGNGYQLSDPGAFLSERSLQRRAWQGLGVDLTDEPVTRAYVEELKELGVEVRHISRWLNGLAMVNATPELYERVLEKPFVTTRPWEPESEECWYPPRLSGSRFEPPLSPPPAFDYGIATEQIRLMDTDGLHGQGYTGRGVWIGLLDAGFHNVDSLPSFRTMISQGRLVMARNFINDSSVFRLVSNHGMYVLSITGAEWDGYMMGTAPHASYLLCATENVHQETRIEEIAWIEAAEFLDSLGCDIFNTSLGYSDFDGTDYDYAYSDMDGKTTFISRAASMVADKGIIACNSAGNEGNKTWYYITAPADATDILGVGAVDSTGLIAGFSSRGPSYDGRVKPDVVAMGDMTGFQYVTGGLARGGGTSFSSPLIAGSVAALWQAFPDIPAKEMIYRVTESGDRLTRPDETYGFGIPSFEEAFRKISDARSHGESWLLEIYPNPASSTVHISLPQEGAGNYLLHFYDTGGRRIVSGEIWLPGGVNLPAGMHPGLYIVEVDTGRKSYRNYLIVQ